MRVRHWTAGLGLLAAAAIATPSLAAGAAAGKTAFKTQCALCHTAEPGDNGGAQGLALTGVFGPKAASNPAFSYTKPLRDSGLTWDFATLDRFVASPTTMLPGSCRVIAVANKSDREKRVGAAGRGGRDEGRLGAHERRRGERGLPHLILEAALTPFRGSVVPALQA